MMERLQEQGRSCYRRKDYTTALEHFNRAVQRGQSVQLLDNRAACHEKLNDLPAALKDAKKSIQLQGEDPTGYLRAGKILLKMEKDSVAEEIYRHGLKRVKHVGQGYELLRTAHDTLRNKLSPPKSVDPLTVLPREVAELILEYLTFRQRVNACLVSKPWAHFIRSAPNLWRHLDLTGTRRKVSNKFVSRAINIGRQRLKKATLSNLFDFDKAITALARSCPIEEFNLLGAGLQSFNLAAALKPAKHLKVLRIGPETLIQRRALWLLLQQCSKQLEVFEVNGLTEHERFLDVESTDGAAFPILKTLKITSSVEPVYLGPVFENMPNLQHLKLHVPFPHIRHSLVDFSVLTKLEELDLRVPFLKLQIEKLPRSLVKLTLDNPSHRQNLGNTPSQTKHYLPCLRELSICNPFAELVELDRYISVVKPEEEQATDSTTQEPSKLHKLSLRSVNFNTWDLKNLTGHPRLKGITEFCFTESEAWIDEAVEIIMEAFKELRIVNFSETIVTGISVKAAVKHGHIQKLVINDCRFVGHDAVEWARSRGLQVEHRMKRDITDGGKKIRY